MNIVILGAGPGGYVSALKAARSGASVTVIERAEVGGTCLNWGCIPTKTLLASTEAYSKAKKLESFGIELRGSIVPNMKKIMDRKNNVVSTQIKGIRGLLKSWGITLKKGEGRFTTPHEVVVISESGSKETIKADAFIVATGSRPSEIPNFPFDGKNIISSTEALELTEIPESMLIIGAGVIGCEFASIYSELGTKVTIAELLPRAVSTEDESISKLLERELKKKKITLLTNIKVERIEINDGSVTAYFSNGKEITVQKVLVSVGRELNSNGIGLEAAGISVGSGKEITVNDRMQTNVPHIYAIGDVTGGILLAHVASKEGMVAADNIMGSDSRIDYSVVPAAIFTSPEIGSVGLREEQAKDKGIPYTVGEFQFRALGKAHAMGEIAGMIKVISEKESHRILGAHIIGPHASDLIHEYAFAMSAGLKSGDIADMIHAHPTLSEGLMLAAEEVHGGAIHSPKR
jgi:dihydrolipoamide dehydrogenase